MSYFDKLKQKCLRDIGANANSFNLSNQIKINTNNGFVTGNGYGNLEMKVLINDKDGYRLYCKSKKGHIELPHYHNGKYELFMIKGLVKYIDYNTREELILGPGDYYYNPPKNPHSSECLEDSEFLWLYDGIPDCNSLEDNNIQDININDKFEE